MRNVGLDILRFLAVLLVIGRHLPLPEDATEILKTWVRGGWIGVDIFFVLSGFLVSSLLFREYKRCGSVNIKRFLIRRGLKIYPAFYLFLLISIVLLWGRGRVPHAQYVLGELLFMQNYLGGIWNHTWSLAVEEHFYIGLALVVVVAIAFSPSRPFHHVPYIFATVAVTCLGFRLLNLVFFPEYTHMRYLFVTHVRLDSLMFGVLLSYLSNFRDLEGKLSAIPSRVFVVTGCFLLSPAFIFQLETNKWISVFGVILFYVGSGCLLIAALRWKTTELPAVDFLAALGQASYSIYLWHMPVAVWGYRFISEVTGYDSFELYCFNAIFGSFLFGWILNRLIEDPILYLRDRMIPSNASVAITERLH